MALKDQVVKRLSPNGDNIPQITIIKREQSSNESYYAKYFIPKEARHLNKNNIYKIESLSTLVIDEAEEKARNAAILVVAQAFQSAGISDVYYGLTKMIR